MLSLGILRDNSIEMVDVTVKGGTIVPGNCPSGQEAFCDQCTYARITKAAPPHPTTVLSSRARERAVSLVLCHWHERQTAP
jgi:hypothetical protein